MKNGQLAKASQRIIGWGRVDDLLTRSDVGTARDDRRSIGRIWRLDTDREHVRGNAGRGFWCQEMAKHEVEGRSEKWCIARGICCRHDVPNSTRRDGEAGKTIA